MKSSILLLCFSLLLNSWMIKGQNSQVNYLKQLDASLYMESADMRMELYKNGKIVRFYEMEFYRKNEKMRMEFTAPAPEKGRRMLNDNASLWMYLPRTSKVMKLPFKQAFMGSDASNSDLMRMTFEQDYEIVNISQKEGDLIELELKATNPEVAYNKTVIHYDTKKNMPVKQEMYSLSGKIIKTLTYENPVQIDGFYVPSTLTITEATQKTSVTKLTYSNIKKKNDKPAEYFTLGSIKR